MYTMRHRTIRRTKRRTRRMQKVMRGGVETELSTKEDVLAQNGKGVYIKNDEGLYLNYKTTGPKDTKFYEFNKEPYLFRNIIIEPITLHYGDEGIFILDGAVKCNTKKRDGSGGFECGYYVSSYKDYTYDMSRTFFNYDSKIPVKIVYDPEEQEPRLKKEIIEKEKRELAAIAKKKADDLKRLMSQKNNRSIQQGRQPIIENVREPEIDAPRPSLLTRGYEYLTGENKPLSAAPMSEEENQENRRKSISRNAAFGKSVNQGAIKTTLKRRPRPSVAGPSVSDPPAVAPSPVADNDE